MTILEMLGQAFVLLGAVIFVAAAIGLHRLTDPYMRTSAVATAAGLGIAFIAAGAALINPSLSTTIKVVIAIALQLATSTVGGMAIARAAVMSQHAFSSTTDRGELDENFRED